MKTPSLHNFTFIVIFSIFSLNILAQTNSIQFEKNKELIIQGNKKYSFKIPLKKGQFLLSQIAQKNVDIQVLALSPENDTLKTFNDNQNGLEVVEHLATIDGTYTLQISPYIQKHLNDSIKQKLINTINGSCKVIKYEVLSAKEYNKKLLFEKAQQDSVITWVKKKSITLNSVKAETGLEDFSDLKELLKNKKVIGLGETSHGTKEIFQMKHRFLEFLVKEMDFRIFAIEASNIGCRPINDYVLYGKGTCREALSSQGFWVWDTEEVIDMIEWMRVYNASVSNDKKVQFLGIDTQMNALDAGYQNVSKFLNNEKVKDRINIEIDSLFHKLQNDIKYSDISSEREQLYQLLSYIVLNEAKFVKRTSKKQYDSVLFDLRKIIQGVESSDDKLQEETSFNIRDEYMAQTVLEILQNEEANTKIMVWAHNGHISKNKEEKANGYFRPLGSALAEYLGDQYYAIGFSTYKGSFQGLNYVVKEKKISGISSFTLPPAEKGSLDWYFAQTGKDIFFLDFNTLGTSNAITIFLNNNLDMYYAGALWSHDYSHTSTQKIIPIKTFDSMIFIEETNRADLTPNGINKIKKKFGNL